MSEYALCGPTFKIKYRDRRFEIRQFYDGFCAGEIKKDGNLRCFHALGGRYGSPTPCFKDVEAELLRAF